MSENKGTPNWSSHAKTADRHSSFVSFTDKGISFDTESETAVHTIRSNEKEGNEMEWSATIFVDVVVVVDNASVVVVVVVVVIVFVKNSQCSGTYLEPVNSLQQEQQKYFSKYSISEFQVTCTQLKTLHC